MKQVDLVKFPMVVETNQDMEFRLRRPDTSTWRTKNMYSYAYTDIRNSA